MCQHQPSYLRSGNNFLSLWTFHKYWIYYIPKISERFTNYDCVLCFVFIFTTLLIWAHCWGEVKILICVVSCFTAIVPNLACVQTMDDEKAFFFFVICFGWLGNIFLMCMSTYKDVNYTYILNLLSGGGNGKS